MHRRTTYRPFLALVLLLGFLLSLGGRGVHVLHEQEEAALRCHAADGSQHVHDHEYAHSPCFLCLSYISQISEEAPILADKTANLVAAAIPDIYTAPHGSDDPRRQPPLRGPPIL